MKRREWLDALAGLLVGLGVVCLATAVYVGFWAWDESEPGPGTNQFGIDGTAETGYRLAYVANSSSNWAIVGVLVIAVGVGVFATPRLIGWAAYLRGARGKGSLVFIRRRGYRTGRR